MLSEEELEARKARARAKYKEKRERLGYVYKSNPTQKQPRLKKTDCQCHTLKINTLAFNNDPVIKTPYQLMQEFTERDKQRDMEMKKEPKKVLALNNKENV